MGDASAKGARDLALILRAWLDDDQDALIRMMRTPEDERAILMQSIALNVFYLKKTNNREAIFDTLLRDDPLHQAQIEVNATEQGRKFLRTALADGPVPRAELRERAESEGLVWKAVDNAAHLMRINRGPHRGTNNPWSLPAIEYLRLALKNGPKSELWLRADALGKHGLKRHELADAATALRITIAGQGDGGTKWSLPSSRNKSSRPNFGPLRPPQRRQ